MESLKISFLAIVESFRWFWVITNSYLIIHDWIKLINLCGITSVAITRLLPYPWKIKVESLQEDWRSYHGRSCLSSSSFLFSMHYRWNNSARARAVVMRWTCTTAGLCWCTLWSHIPFSVCSNWLYQTRAVSLSWTDKCACPIDDWVSCLPLQDLIRKTRVWTTMSSTRTQQIYISGERDSSTLYNCMALFSLSSGVILSSVNVLTSW